MLSSFNLLGVRACAPSCNTLKALKAHVHDWRQGCSASAGASFPFEAFTVDEPVGDLSLDEVTTGTWYKAHSDSGLFRTPKSVEFASAFTSIGRSARAACTTRCRVGFGLCVTWPSQGTHMVVRRVPDGSSGRAGLRAPLSGPILLVSNKVVAVWGPELAAFEAHAMEAAASRDAVGGNGMDAPARVGLSFLVALVQAVLCDRTALRDDLADACLLRALAAASETRQRKQQRRAAAAAGGSAGSDQDAPAAAAGQQPRKRQRKSTKLGVPFSDEDSDLEVLEVLPVSSRRRVSAGSPEAPAACPPLPPSSPAAPAVVHPLPPSPPAAPAVVHPLPPAPAETAAVHPPPPPPAAPAAVLPPPAETTAAHPPPPFLAQPAVDLFPALAGSRSSSPLLLFDEDILTDQELHELEDCLGLPAGSPAAQTVTTSVQPLPRLAAAATPPRMTTVAMSAFVPPVVMTTLPLWDPCAVTTLSLKFVGAVKPLVAAGGCPPSVRAAADAVLEAHRLLFQAVAAAAFE